jgi:hypothetical protein
MPRSESRENLILRGRPVPGTCFPGRRCTNRGAWFMIPRMDYPDDADGDALRRVATHSDMSLGELSATVGGRSDGWGTSGNGP